MRLLRPAKTVAPISFSQTRSYNLFKERLVDHYEGEEPQDQDKIREFLTPLGLADYAEKFTSWDMMLNTRSPILKLRFGMNCKERKLLRKKCNNWRMVQYFSTGIPYQYTRCVRTPIKPTSVRYRDESSEDDLALVVPTADGLYLTHLKYPGAPEKPNKFVKSYKTMSDARYLDQYDTVEVPDVMLDTFDWTPFNNLDREGNPQYTAEQLERATEKSAAVKAEALARSEAFKPENRFGLKKPVTPRATKEEDE